MFVAGCFFVSGTEGVFLPIIVPMFRVRSVRDDRLLFTLVGVEGLVELTAGCFAPVGAEELRVPIVLPIRERWLVVGCLFAFDAGGVLRLLEPPIREAPLERAAGWFAPLGTDGLVVLIVLPIREVMLGLIRLLVLVVERFVIVFRDLLGGWVLVLLEEVDRLLDGVLVLIELPMREVMLELILPLELLWLLELGTEVRELIDRLEVLLLELGTEVRELIDRLEVLLLELGTEVRELIDRLDVLLLELGTEVRELIDRLDVLLLDMLLLGVRLVILLLGVLLVIDLLELLLLGDRLVMLLLELRLDETLLDRLGVALGAGAGLETCRLG